jgi:hypothetical protein
VQVAADEQTLALAREIELAHKKREKEKKAMISASHAHARAHIDTRAHGRHTGEEKATPSALLSLSRGLTAEPCTYTVPLH